MGDKKSVKTAKMWNAKIFLSSVVAGLAAGALSWMVASRDRPQEGHIFDRTPTVNGIYRCCDNGGRFSRSWVGGVVVECLGISYYFIGSGRNDCGLREQLNGHYVEVEQVLVPTSAGLVPAVSKITSDGNIYYEQSDQRIRDRWISGTITDAQSHGFWGFLLMYFVQFIYFNRKENSSKGDKK